jgi:hypothetical protein
VSVFDERFNFYLSAEIMLTGEKRMKLSNLMQIKELHGGAGEIRTPDTWSGIQRAVLIGVENF